MTPMVQNLLVNLVLEMVSKTLKGEKTGFLTQTLGKVPVVMVGRTQRVTSGSQLVGGVEHMGGRIGTYRRRVVEIEMFGHFNVNR
ncbi:hypothetical protein PS914_01084 [Pseudomonas fluorescens]|nr:hypothetical protein PS914_01084 [Pseudomonas fluorescens]